MHVHKSLSVIELCKTQKTAEMGIIDHLFNI